MTIGRRSSGRIALGPGDRDGVATVIRAADAAQANDDWKGSCDILRAGVAQRPEDVELLVRLGEALRFSERHAEALLVVERAAAIAPDDFAALLELASSARMRGDEPKTMTAVTRLHALFPDDPDARSALAMAKSAFGRPEEARTIAKALVAENPERLEFVVDHAGALVRMGRHNEAIAELESVLEKRPKFYEAWILLAEASKRLHRATAWTAAVRRANAIAPNVGRSALWMYRLVAAEEPASEQAVRHLQRALELNVDLGEAHLEMAAYHLKTSDEARAGERLTHAARAWPWDGKAVGMLAQFQIVTGTGSPDLDALGREARARPYARLPYYLGRLYLATLKDDARALPFLELAVECGQEDLDAIQLLGEAHKIRGEYDLAIARYRRATELSRTLGPAWDGLGFAYFHKGALSEAAAAYEVAVKHLPKDAIVRHAYGETLLEMRRVHESVMHLLRAVALDPKNPNIQASLALAFDAAGKPDEALRAALRAKEALSGDEELDLLIERLTPT